MKVILIEVGFAWPYRILLLIKKKELVAIGRIHSGRLTALGGMVLFKAFFDRSAESTVIEVESMTKTFAQVPYAL